MSEEIYVGTSGWMYDWNRGGSLDWYVRESGLNAVELNASFYRLPFKNQVLSWARKGEYLRWAIKIHRFITHYARLSEKAITFWNKFRDVFEQLDEKIDFYLLQLPPSYNYTMDSLDRIKKFIEKTGIPDRMAIEFRHSSWFMIDKNELCEELMGAILVSIDSPDYTYYTVCHGTIYLRLHGRSSWYLHEYSEEELIDIVNKIVDLKPSRVYVFFNNNHWMLDNARLMKNILQKRFFS